MVRNIHTRVCFPVVAASADCDSKLQSLQRPAAPENGVINTKIDHKTILRCLEQDVFLFSFEQDVCHGTFAVDCHIFHSVSVIRPNRMTNNECPLANPDVNARSIRVCPFHAHDVLNHSEVNVPVRPNIIGGTHHTSPAQAALLADIGGGDRIREFTTRFYARAFLDHHIKDFFFLDDGATAHAKRLADWIIQKMGGEGEPWTASGRLGMRQPSHSAAWHSEKRPPALRGQHFKLDDCRIWMRLNFWAARECGLNEHEVFWEWYIQFIQHFIAVYERTAPRYAAADAEWAADPANTEAYLAGGCVMADVIGRW